MNHLRSIAYLLLQLLITPPYALLSLATFCLPRKGRYWVISGWAKMMIALAGPVLGIRYRVEGLENLPPGPAIILAKHQSAWETMAFQAIFPPQVHVLKRELLWIPFFGWGLAMMSPIAIDRSKGTSALKRMAELGSERFAQGFWIVVFPEGTRTSPGEQRPYQIGGAWLAHRLKAPVVPVAHNAGLCWPRNAFFKRPGVITVRIGKPIDASGLKPDALNEQVRLWIENEMATLCPD